MRKIIDTISVFSDDKQDAAEEEEKRNIDTSSISNYTKEITNNAVIEKDFSLRDEISQISENISIQSEFFELSDLNKSTLTEKEETPRPEGTIGFNNKAEENLNGNNNSNYNKERMRSSTNLNKSYNSKKNYYKKNPRNSTRGGGGAGGAAGRGGGGAGYKVVYEKKN